MKRFRTLRVRFAIWTASLVLLVLVVFGFYVYSSLSAGLTAALDNSLELTASQMIASMETEEVDLALPEGLVAGPAIPNLAELGLTVRLFTPQGELLQELGPFHLPAPPLGPASLPSFVTAPDMSSNITLRVYNAPAIINGSMIAVVQIAQSMQAVQMTQRQLLAILLVSIPVLVLVAALGGYWLAARALAPVDRISSTARQISAQDLTARLNLPRTDDEVGRLAATFDEMLARLELSFRKERQFTADASHELRTPLAAMQAILSVMREKRRSPAEYEQALADLADESDRLQILVQDLLQLARQEPSEKTNQEVIDISTLLHDVIDSLRPLAEAKNLALKDNIDSGLTIFGDRDSLIRLFVNLIDNAIKFTQLGEITVSAQTGDGIEVVIQDTGVGIAQEHLPHIFQRFYRIDKARSGDGVGLGLAIAEDIARAHGGKIWAESVLGKGAVFHIQLPTQNNQPIR